MDFFHLKSKNSFSSHFCAYCNFSSHNKDDLVLHEKNCRNIKNNPNYERAITNTFDNTLEEISNFNAAVDLDHSDNPTPISFKLIKTNYSGYKSNEISLGDNEYEMHNLNKIHHQNNNPLLEISLKNSESFQSCLSLNKSLNNFNQNASFSQNSSNQNQIEINNLNIKDTSVGFKDYKICIISPHDLRDRKQKNRKCIVCYKLKIGDMVKVFECNDIVHWQCFSDNLFGLPCPNCKGTIQ